MFSQAKIVIAGAGFAGAVIAERIASVLKEKVIIIDRRKHIGGTSFSEIDPDTGIECHLFGSHIFHTAIPEVWNYLRRFTDFNTYRHKVLTTWKNRVFTMPINLKTINDFYGTNLKPYEVEKFIDGERSKSACPDTDHLEGKAISLVGEKLYQAFICGYTRKQWNRDPKQLPAEIISRLKIRNNYNADYFNDPYQGIPLNGYGELFQNLLKNPLIEIKLGIDFREIRTQLPPDCTVFYSGSLDELCDCRFGELSWRSLRFEWQDFQQQDWQGCAVMNYADPEIPYTRTHEFKHYHPEREKVFHSSRTRICYEYSENGGQGKEPFYPVETPENLRKYQCYRESLRGTGIIPIGRLGSYKYWDIDKTIKNSLDVFEQFKKGKSR